MTYIGKHRIVRPLLLRPPVVLGVTGTALTIGAASAFASQVIDDSPALEALPAISQSEVSDAGGLPTDESPPVETSTPTPTETTTISTTSSSIRRWSSSQSSSSHTTTSKTTTSSAPPPSDPTDGSTDGSTDGPTDGSTDGPTDGSTDGPTDGDSDDEQPGD